MALRCRYSTRVLSSLRRALCAGGALGYTLASAAPAGAYCVYVPNNEAHSISVIDTATNSLSATIEAEFDEPEAPALTPDARYLYIANRGDSDHPGNTVLVIDTVTNTVVSTVTVTVGSGPASIAITPNGTFAYVSSWFGSTLMIIDTARALTDPSHAMVNTIEIPGAGQVLGSLISPDGRFAYTTACGPCEFSTSSASFVTLVDTNANTIRTTVPGTWASAFTPDGALVYGVNPVTGTFLVTDTAKALSDPSHAIIAVTPVGVFPYGVAVTPDGRSAYVPNCGEYCRTDEPSSVSTVSVIDTTTNKVAATVPLAPESGPTGIAITPDGAWAYVPEGWSQSVAVIDTAKAVMDPAHAVIKNIGVAGPRPQGIVIAPLPMCVNGHPTCVGDCSVDRQATVDELVTMVNIALGNADVSGCEAGDLSQDGQITVDEILTAVNNALNGC